MEACAFRGACAGRSAVGDTALSVLDERTYRRRRANHQDTVMTFHLAGADCLSVGRDQHVGVGWPGRCELSAKPSGGMDLDVIGNC